MGKYLHAPRPPRIRTAEAMKALQAEFQEVRREMPDSICRMDLVDCDLFSWEVALTGPESSAYSGGTFRFALKFPINYACTDQLPSIRCFTPVFHCNIDKNGTVCWGGLLAAHVRRDGQHTETKREKGDDVMGGHA